MKNRNEEIRRKIISYGRTGKTVQVVIITSMQSMTRHLKKAGDMWLDSYGTSYDLSKFK